MALGWGSAPAVFHGLVLPQVPRPSCLPFFFASGPPLLSCALSESSRLCCFCLSSWSLGGSVLCFWLCVRVVGSLSLRLFPRSPYLSLLFVPLPLLHLSLDLWVFLLPFLSLLVGGFYGGGFRSSGSGASFLSWLRLSCLSPLVSFCCLCSSPGFWLFAVSSSFSCALCVVLPAQASLLRSFLSPGLSGGRSSLSASLFLFASLFPGGIMEFFFCLLSLPSLLLLLRLCWVLFILSTTLCWPCSPDLCFPFSSSWASLPWTCSCRVLFSGSVGVPLKC